MIGMRICRRSILAVLPTIMCGVLLATSAHAQSIRCGRRIISVGDTAYELQQRCGRPAYRAVRQDFRAQTVIGPDGNAIQQVVDEPVQVLTYSGERGDLLRIIEVRRGIVTAIRIGPRVQSVNDPGCARSIVRSNATEGEVRMACGRPVDVSRWSEERAIKVGRQIVRRRVQIERWVYDPGPGQLLRILEFQNGRLVDTKTGRRSPSRN